MEQVLVQVRRPENGGEEGVVCVSTPRPGGTRSRDPSVTEPRTVSGMGPGLRREGFGFPLLDLVLSSCRPLSLSWRVVEAGTGNDVGESGEEPSKGWAFREQNRHGAFFPQRKAEPDFGATEGESLRE